MGPKTNPNMAFTENTNPIIVGVVLKRSSRNPTIGNRILNPNTSMNIAIHKGAKIRYLNNFLLLFSAIDHYPTLTFKKNKIKLC